jgi:hypothetical protein
MKPENVTTENIANFLSHAKPSAVIWFNEHGTLCCKCQTPAQAKHLLAAKPLLKGECRLKIWVAEDLFSPRFTWIPGVGIAPHPEAHLP